MKADIDTEILETILVHAKTAARFASYINDPIVVDGFIVLDELVKSLDDIGRMVAERLGKPYGAQATEEATQDGEPEFNVANSVDILRQFVARADALASAAESLFDEVVWVKDEGDGRQFERLAHLVGATTDAVREAILIGDKLAVTLATRRPRA